MQVIGAAGTNSDFMDRQFHHRHRPFKTDSYGSPDVRSRCTADDETENQTCGSGAGADSGGRSIARAGFGSIFRGDFHQNTHRVATCYWHELDAFTCHSSAVVRQVVLGDCF